jgi:NAD(P)-dependent dehydrogenase (short-subunit alcohol dehydrogenase family)
MTAPTRSPRLATKLAVITGAARGIGRACAVEFAAEGADLVLVDAAEDSGGGRYPLGTWSQLRHTAELCRANGAHVTPVRLDVRDSLAAGQLVERTLDEHGRIDVLVHTAGLAGAPGTPLHEVRDEQWQLLLDVDLGGAFRMVRAVLPSMIRYGAGSIVTVASNSGTVGYRDVAGHVAANHGVVGLTRAAALDYGPMGIRVNAVCPGPVRDDPRWEAGPPGPDEADRPSDRLVDAGAVARTALWLAGDESRLVTGAVITVDGGRTAW